MYKAVFIDMDGTLLQKDHTVSKATKKAISHLLEKGVLVVPISARPLHGMLPVTRQVVPAGMPVVSLNGSYIFYNNEIIYQASISLPDASIIHTEISQYNISVMYYSQMKWFAPMDSGIIQKEQKITDVKINIQPFEQTVNEWKLNNNGPNKILIAGDRGTISNIEERLLLLHDGQLNIYKSKPVYLEVMHLEASKTKAMQLLLNKFGIDKSETIAIGDNYNDKGMIEFAGMGVAMGNAPDDIKMVADYVTDTNNNDGVAKALNYFF